MVRKERWAKKVKQLLENAGVVTSPTPTNILFVSNSSVICGVDLETLETTFFAFDSKCTFIVYPKYKSYSFVTFSTIDKAIAAYLDLNDTQPPGFPKEIALFYVSNLPEDESLLSNTKGLQGLRVIPDFITANEESKIVKFIESQKCSPLKNRKVIHFGYEFNYSVNNALCPAEPIPQIFLQLISRITNHNSINLPVTFQPDQVTVNIYEPGQGIPPHVDTHSAFEEPIISLSILSNVVMEFRDCANLRNFAPILLPSNSLLVITGAARYRYKHGILSRKYDIDLTNNRLLRRERRISVTFRQIRQIACACPFIEFCDWDRQGKMTVPSNNFDGQNLENEYVSKVYEAIAEHFDETRHSNWGVVNNFLNNLEDNSIVLDAGCGNGKYLIRSDHLCKIGGDICEKLVKIAYDKGCSVFRGDALSLPIRDSSVDAVISIAVIHHFSTRDRRKRALLELQRVLRSGGTACVTVWAIEQQRKLNGESAYSKMKKLKKSIDEDHDDQSVSKNMINNGLNKLCVHDGRNTFTQQDIFVPWNPKRLEKTESEQKQHLRYYHLFLENELPELIKELSKCQIKHIEFEEGNWAVIFEKL